MKKIFIMLVCAMSLVGCYESTESIVDISPEDHNTAVVTLSSGYSFKTNASCEKYFANIGDKVLVKSCCGDKSYWLLQNLKPREIVNKTVNKDEFVYTFDTGEKMFVKGNKLYFYNRFKQCIRAYQIDDPTMRIWHNCEVGQKGRVTFGSRGYVSIHMENLADYTKERIVTKVTKYDGHYAQIDGKINLQSNFLSGTSGKGQISGESGGGEDFFINIYFTEGDPISVNASDNLLWLDIAPGDIVVETRELNKVCYTPKVKH